MFFNYFLGAVRSKIFWHPKNVCKFCLFFQKILKEKKLFHSPPLRASSACGPTRCAAARTCPAAAARTRGPPHRPAGGPARSGTSRAAAAASGSDPVVDHNTSMRICWTKKFFFHEKCVGTRGHHVNHEEF